MNKSRAALIRKQEITIEGLQGVVNELLEENHELKQKLVAQYDEAHENQQPKGNTENWTST